MKVWSLFSGIGGFDLAFERAGFEITLQVENNPACQSVLKRHYPNVERLDDVRDVIYDGRPVDVMVGGFPCQDVSVSGSRAGLAGSRSGLWFEFLRLIGSAAPRWIIIENVPGLLSSNRGRDFAVVVHGLVECGYRIAWRVLDAQYWGLAQRRKRVFIVGCLGSGRAVEILFEREGGFWNTLPRTEKGQSIAGTLAGSAAGTARPAGQRNELDFLISFQEQRHGEYKPDDLASTLSARDFRSATDLIAFIQNQREEVRDLGSLAGTLSGEPGMHQQNYIAFSNRGKTTGDIAETVRAGSHGALPMSLVARGVRRLTPLECERLQGFPDAWTAGQSDSTRYRQLGNAVAVPVVEWIARRLMEQTR